MMFSRAFCLALLAAACVSLPYAFASEENTVALIAGDDQKLSISRVAQIANYYGHGHGHGGDSCRGIRRVCSHRSQCCTRNCIKGIATAPLDSFTCCPKGTLALGATCLNAANAADNTLCCSGFCRVVGAATVCTAT